MSTSTASSSRAFSRLTPRELRRFTKVVPPTRNCSTKCRPRSAAPASPSLRGAGTQRAAAVKGPVAVPHQPPKQWNFRLPDRPLLADSTRWCLHSQSGRRRTASNPGTCPRGRTSEVTHRTGQQIGSGDCVSESGQTTPDESRRCRHARRGRSSYVRRCARIPDRHTRSRRAARERRHWYRA